MDWTRVSFSRGFQVGPGIEVIEDAMGGNKGGLIGADQGTADHRTIELAIIARFTGRDQRPAEGQADIVQIVFEGLDHPHVVGTTDDFSGGQPSNPVVGPGSIKESVGRNPEHLRHHTVIESELLRAGIVLRNLFAGGTAHGTNEGDDVIAGKSCAVWNDLRGAQESHDTRAADERELRVVGTGGHALGRNGAGVAILSLRAWGVAAPSSVPDLDVIGDGEHVIGEVVEAAITVANRVQENRGILVDDRLVAVVPLYVQPQRKNADNGNEREANDREADRDLDHLLFKDTATTE